jgi:hypothetical protein
MSRRRFLAFLAALLPAAWLGRAAIAVPEKWGATYRYSATGINPSFGELLDRRFEAVLMRHLSQHDQIVFHQAFDA